MHAELELEDERPAELLELAELKRTARRLVRRRIAKLRAELRAELRESMCGASGAGVLLRLSRPAANPKQKRAQGDNK